MLSILKGSIYAFLNENLQTEVFFEAGLLPAIKYYGSVTMSLPRFSVPIPTVLHITIAAASCIFHIFSLMRLTVAALEFHRASSEHHMFEEMPCSDLCISSSPHWILSAGLLQAQELRKGKGFFQNKNKKKKGRKSIIILCGSCC